jgi:hypothetical protein
MQKEAVAWFDRWLSNSTSQPLRGDIGEENSWSIGAKGHALARHAWLDTHNILPRFDRALL